MAFPATKPAQGEMLVPYDDRQYIRKPNSRSGIWHLARIIGSGYYVAGCHTIFNARRVVFAPKKNEDELCLRCKENKN